MHLPLSYAHPISYLFSSALVSLVLFLLLHAQTTLLKIKGNRRNQIPQFYQAQDVFRNFIIHLGFLLQILQYVSLDCLNFLFKNRILQVLVADELLVYFSK